MACQWRSFLVGFVASALAVPAAWAEDCVETTSRVPMMSPMAAGPGAPHMPKVGPPIRPPRAAMARLSPPRPAAKAQVRKATRIKAVAHKASRPRKLAHRRAAPPQLAATMPPKGYPDARLMMTRIAPAPEPQFALIRTIACTTGAPGGRLMPFLVAAPSGPPATGTFLDGEGPLIIGPPFGPPPDDSVVVLPRPPGPPGPPVGPPGPQITPVPEPSTWALLMLGFGGLGLVLRRRRPVAS